MDKIIVHCPEKWQYIKLVELVGWWNENVALEGMRKNYWDNYKDNTVIRIEKEKIEGYVELKTYKEYYTSYIFYTYEKFINKFFPKERQGNNIMGIIKNVFKTKKEKALSEFEITNGDGGLTDEGRNEWIDFLWEKEEDLKAEFVDLMVKEYEKKKKK